FRDTAKYWKQSAQNPAILITGPLLDRARSYHDLDDVERSFVEACRNRELRATRLYRGLTFVFVPLAVLGMALAGWLAVGEFNARNEKVKEHAEQERAEALIAEAKQNEEMLLEENAKWKKAYGQALVNQRNAEQLRDEVTKSRDEVIALLQALLDEKLKMNLAPDVRKKYQERLDALLPKKDGKSDPYPRTLQTKVRPVRPGVAVGPASSKS